MKLLLSAVPGVACKNVYFSFEPITSENEKLGTHLVRISETTSSNLHGEWNFVDPLELGELPTFHKKHNMFSCFGLAA